MKGFSLFFWISSAMAAPEANNKSSFLSSYFWNQKAEGWHWYEAFPEQEIIQPGILPKIQSPTEILEAFKAEVTQKLHKALVNPSFENVKAYQEIQKKLMDRSEAFSKRWLEVLYQTPHLDETVTYPISQAARHTYLDHRRRSLQQLLKKLAQRYGLLFFFQGNCPYCHQFAPLVKQFSKIYGWSVLAVSLDGTVLKDFPDAKPDNGAAASLNIETVPALISVNPKTGNLIPVSFGMRSMDQLEEHFYLLAEQRAFE